MSFLTKLPQEVLEQVSHIFKQKTPSQIDHSGTLSGMGWMAGGMKLSVQQVNKLVRTVVGVWFFHIVDHLLMRSL